MVNEGKIIDASFVEAPRQRNSRENNQQIKEGKGEGLWTDEPNKKRQKDIDARWTKKNNQHYYGYKNHAKVDAGSKLIERYEITDASVHDSQALDALLDKNKTKNRNCMPTVLIQTSKKYSKNIELKITYMRRATKTSR